jgi:ketopantoate reductase
VGSQKKGPLIIGTPDNTLQDEMGAIRDIINPAIETIITTELQNAVHTKIALNSANALTTLIGYGVQPITDYNSFQTLITNIIWETIQILKTEGYEEYQLPDFTSWSALEQLIKLPISATQDKFLGEHVKNADFLNDARYYSKKSGCIRIRNNKWIYHEIS